MEDKYEKMQISSGGIDIVMNFFKGIDVKSLEYTIANYKLTPQYRGEDSYLIMSSDTLAALKAQNTKHLVLDSRGYCTYGCLSIAICEKLNIGEVEFR